MQAFVENGMLDIPIQMNPNVPIENVQVDVFYAAAVISRARIASQGEDGKIDPVLYVDRLKEAMMGLGFPGMSHRVLHAISEKIMKEDEGFAKKDGLIQVPDAAPESPSSTASIPTV